LSFGTPKNDFKKSWKLHHWKTQDRIESLNSLSGALAEIEKNFVDLAQEVESHL
jgi:hypothetical protein